MRLIFIRHGDPDYKNDDVTEKGKREVELLTKRVTKWDITKICCSPLGRAQATAKPSIQILREKSNIQVETYPWLQEFYYYQNGKKTGVCWDFLPEFYTSQKKFFNKDKWYKSSHMKKGNVHNNYKNVCNGIDSLLAEYGYIRNKKGFYTVQNQKINPNFDPNNKIERYQLVSEKHLKEDTTLVFFCHLGVMFTIIGHLTGISPVQLWQGFYVAPTSVTVLNTEERLPEQAYFRVERLGDTNHLTNGGEPISSSGYFTDILSEI